MKKMILSLLTAGLILPVGASVAFAEEGEDAVRLTPDELVFGDPKQFEAVEVELVYPDTYDENNELVQSMHEFVEANKTVGDNGKVTFSFTGNYVQTDDMIGGIFYIVNKTGHDLKDFDLNVSMSVKGEEIFKDLKVEYRADDMIVLPNNSLIPITLPIEVDHAEALKGIESYKDMDIQADVTPIDPAE